MRPTVRQVLLAAAAALLLALVGAVGLVASEFRGLSPVVDGQPLGNLGYIVQDGYTSLAVLDAGDRQLVLVDAGNDPAGVAVLAALAAHGQAPEQVTAILLTHGHRDHVAATPRFPLARVYGLAAEAPFLAGEQPFRGPLPRLFGAVDTGVRLSRALRDGEEVTVGTLSARVYAVPGHTAGSAAWSVGRFLFLGDSGSATVQGQLVGAPWVFSDDEAQNVASLHALAARLQQEDVVPDRIVMSHTGVLPGAALRGLASVRR